MNDNEILFNAIWRIKTKTMVSMITKSALLHKKLTCLLCLEEFSIIKNDINSLCALNYKFTRKTSTPQINVNEKNTTFLRINSCHIPKIYHAWNTWELLIREVCRLDCQHQFLVRVNLMSLVKKSKLDCRFWFETRFFKKIPESDIGLRQ